MHVVCAGATMKRVVPPGYKQTEVGVIPEDWDLQVVGGIATTVASGRSHVNSQFGDYPVYGSTGIIGRSIQSDYEGKAILIARVGANAGKLAVVDGEYGVTDNTIMVKIGSSISIDYFWRQLEAKRLNTMVFGSGQPLITGTQIKNLVIPLPPTKAEQEAIAEALSDTDALIESLEQLIAKKHHLKQGTMQELLTGKKRLPGFGIDDDAAIVGETGRSPLPNVPHGWEVKRLGELCEKITTGRLDANAMKESGEYPFFTCAKEHHWIDQYAFDTEALLVSGNGANVGYVHYYDGKFNAYQRTYVLSGFHGDIQFVKLFMERNLQERIRVEVNAGNTPYIVMGTLTDMLVALPVDLPEQTAIAAILSDMDAEIAALETKLAKTRQLKQGMMHNLLTGRIRLL